MTEYCWHAGHALAIARSIPTRPSLLIKPPTSDELSRLTHTIAHRVGRYLERRGLLEIFGAPDIEPRQLLTAMEHIASQWMKGCILRECWFEPTFHKYVGQLCAGIQIHVDGANYDHQAFRPWRLMALAFKALRRIRPDYPLWRDFTYEYENDHLAIDLINGSDVLRRWMDDKRATPADLEGLAYSDEHLWQDECAAVLFERRRALPGRLVSSMPGFEYALLPL